MRTSASCTNREASGFPVAGASESIMFSVALVSKQANTDQDVLLQFWTRQSIFQMRPCGRLRFYEFNDRRFPIVSVKRQPVSPPLRCKDVCGRQSTSVTAEGIVIGEE